jgi:hypothetical protein
MINEITDIILNVINSIVQFFLHSANFLIKHIGTSEILIIAGCILILLVWVFQDKVEAKLLEIGLKP